jgi:hypothetical protein
LIASGYFIEDACTAVGISRKRFHDWMKLAKEGKEEYKEFAWKINQAKIKDKKLVETALRDLALSEDKNNFQAMRYYLSHKYPREWGDKDNQKMRETILSILEVVEKNTDKETYMSICAQLGEEPPSNSEELEESVDEVIQEKDD